MFPLYAGTGEASPGILCSVLNPSLQERYRGLGVYPEKGNKAVRDVEHKSDREQLKELRLFSLEEARGRPH